MSAISLINSGVAWFFSKSVKWLDSWNWRRGW